MAYVKHSWNNLHGHINLSYRFSPICKLKNKNACKVITGTNQLSTENNHIHVRKLIT